MLETKRCIKMGLSRNLCHFYSVLCTVALLTETKDFCQYCQFTELACSSSTPGSQNVYRCNNTIPVSGETCIEIDATHGTNCASITNAVANEHVEINWTSPIVTVQVCNTILIVNYYSGNILRGLIFTVFLGWSKITNEICRFVCVHNGIIMCKKMNLCNVEDHLYPWKLNPSKSSGKSKIKYRFQM